MLSSSRTILKCEDREGMYIYRGFILKYEGVPASVRGQGHWQAIPSLFPEETILFTGDIAIYILDRIDDYWYTYRNVALKMVK